MGVLLTQTCSEGRKENDWFTDSTNETEARAGSIRLNVRAEGLRNSPEYKTDVRWRTHLLQVT